MANLVKGRKTQRKPAPAVSSSAVATKKLVDLTPDSRNANKGSPRGNQMIEDSLRQYGAGRSILLDKHGRIIAGNKTAENAGAIGMDDVIVVQSDGTRLVAVQRTDLDLDDPHTRQFAIADNRAGQVSLDWDVDALKGLVDDGVNLAPFWTTDELKKLWPCDSDSGWDQTDLLSEKFSVLVDCASESEQVKLIERMTLEGYQCRSLIA